MPNGKLLCPAYLGFEGVAPKMIIENYKKYLQYAGYTVVGATALLAAIKLRQKKMVNSKNVIIITGCDSGLGFNLALRCHHNLGMFVVATCYSLNSDGAAKLLESCNPKRFQLIELDITKARSISQMQRSIDKLLENNRDLILTALVNNAGVMCFGELEWQTEQQIVQQFEVNVMGTIRVTKSLLQQLREHKGRIITVTSHCALTALPGLAPYAASKAAMKFVSDSLRIEMRKYGVDVVNFIPGSFFMSSNIAARQQEYADEQRNAFNVKQRSFYGEYFERYNASLKIMSGHKPANVMNDEGLMLKFEAALLEIFPKAVYKYEPWRYKVYHFLFYISPVLMKDALIEKFMAMPRYTKKPSTTV